MSGKPRNAGIQVPHAPWESGGVGHLWQHDELCVERPCNEGIVAAVVQVAGERQLLRFALQDMGGRHWCKRWSQRSKSLMRT